MTVTAVAALLDQLKARGIALGTVESCTGGLIARLVTAIPGSSEAFWGALVTYDNSAKEALVGVPSELLLEHGAVSPEVARAMAEGGLRRMREAYAASRSASIRAPRALVCVATTGIAGPSGGSAEKPVGLCHLALAVGTGPGASRCIARELRVDPGWERQRIQEAFADAALHLVQSEGLR